MTSRVPKQLPGSKGPFPGPSAKQIADLEKAINSDPSRQEGGISYDPAMHVADGSKYAGGVAQPTVNNARFYELEPIQHPWRLVAARTHLVTPGVPAILSCALYAFRPPSILRAVMGSLVTFSFTDTGTLESATSTDVLLYPEYTYFGGFWYTSSVTRSWAGNTIALHAESLTHVFNLPCGGLPTEVDLTNATVMESPSTLGERCLISCKYLTSLGKVLL